MRRAALLVLLAASLGMGWKALPGRTPAIGGPDPIAVLEPVEIGGMTQWLLIRGQDRSAPVLLWLDGATRGSGTMWPDYRARDLMVELRALPVPLLLISGARDLNTPVELAAEWFDSVAAPQGKRHEVFDASGHAPFLTEPDRFTETLRDFVRGQSESP